MGNVLGGKRAESGVQAKSDGGWVIVADVSDFPVSEDMSGALVKLNAGGMRQLHWHTNLDEWQYVINGTIQVRSYPHVQAGLNHQANAGFEGRGFPKTWPASPPAGPATASLD